MFISSARDYNVVLVVCSFKEIKALVFKHSSPIYCDICNMLHSTCLIHIRFTKYYS